MKLKLIFLLVFAGICLPSVAQVKIQKKNCYDRLDSLNRNRKSRYVDFDCGKMAGVVDCNEKLELDPGTGMLLTQNFGSPFTGTCETCHRNGILEHRITFLNGREQGTDTTYYETGCTMVIRNHIEGKEHGQWTYFFDSLGRVAWEMNYNMGEKHGIQVFFNKKGDTISLETYKNGILDGPKKSYFKDSSKVEKASYYSKGLLNGPFIVYNRAGKEIQKLNYKNGQKDGTFSYYYDDGVLLRTENWSKGVKNGSFKTLYYEGTVQVIENYKNGLREGWFEERFPDQKMKRQALYKKDVLIEEHVFNEQGEEIKSFGTPTNKKEDDEIPTGKSKKEKKKKKKE